MEQVNIWGMLFSASNYRKGNRKEQNETYMNIQIQNDTTRGIEEKILEIVIQNTQSSERNTQIKHLDINTEC